jgi:hypothetical protein
MSFYTGSALAYAQSVSGQPCPTGFNPQIWGRIQQIARDTRLPSVDPALLPDSYCAVYELTKMSTPLLDRLVRIGVIRAEASSRELERIRVTGRIRVRIDTEIEAMAGDPASMVDVVGQLPGVLKSCISS